MTETKNRIQSIEAPKRKHFWWEVAYTIDNKRCLKSFLDVVKAYTFFNKNNFTQQQR